MPAARVQIKKEGDKKVPRGELDRLSVEQGDGLQKTFREVMKERNEKMRAAAAEGKFAGSSKEVMSRYETTEAEVMDDHEDSEVIRSIRRGSTIISALEKSFQHSSRIRPQRSNSYNSLFIKREEDDEEPKSLKRVGDDVSRRDRMGKNDGKELFSEKTRMRSGEKHGRRGRGSGYAPAPATSPSIKSEQKEDPSISTASTHRKHRRSSLRSPTAIRKGELRRTRQRTIQLRDTPGTPIKQEGNESDGKEARRVGRGTAMLSTINKIPRQHPNLQVTFYRHKDAVKELLKSALRESRSKLADPFIKREHDETDPPVRRDEANGVGDTGVGLRPAWAKEQVEEETCAIGWLGSFQGSSCAC